MLLSAAEFASYVAIQSARLVLRISISLRQNVPDSHTAKWLFLGQHTHPRSRNYTGLILKTEEHRVEKERPSKTFYITILFILFISVAHRYMLQFKGVLRLLFSMFLLGTRTINFVPNSFMYKRGDILLEH